MKPIAFVSAMLLAAAWAAPATAEITVRLEPVAEGLTAPLMIVSPPGDRRRFVVEQIGTIRILGEDGKPADEPFLNIRHRLIDLKPDFDERGLLSLAFHPNFRENGRFYVAYSGRLRGDAGMDAYLWYSHTNYVAEYTVSKDDPNIADPTSERIVHALEWPQFNHNGHWIGFGPDGMLYISTGDGGYANDWGIGHTPATGNGQDMTNAHGKILRVDVDAGRPYGIPADNPFVNDPEALPEIWASGFRNPWRCSFDMGGDRALICADVGQNSFEEVDVVERGRNYGWRIKEGRHCFDYLNPNTHPANCDQAGLVDPVIEYRNCNVTPDCKGLSITGGHVYRGSHEPWRGLYFFGDWSRSFAAHQGSLFAARPTAEGWKAEDVRVEGWEGELPYILGFGQDNAGEVYVTTSLTTGPVGGLDRIFRLVPADPAVAERP
ncbi:MAG: PQQ-dependent sugar dehydrogenase [Alphaproteobacteria bacterium]|nr:PQQ-dependent sugar dehydrogenase [Alphaproteobacteria bacterium]